MIGMHRGTGRPLDGLVHIAQSIGDILATPVGTRCMRREYGSDVPGLLDQPATAATLLRVKTAAIVALAAWEPRVRVDAIDLTPDHAAGPGIYRFDLQVTLTETGAAAALSVPVRAAAAA